MQTYSHSGAVPPLGALSALAAGLATAFVGAFLYAYGFLYIPIIYVNILLTMAFGGAIGFVVAKVAEWGKVRNNLVVSAGGLLAGLAGLYLYWGAYCMAFFGFGQTGLVAFMPRGILFLANHLYQNGYWAFTENNPVKGWFLVAIWIVEACVVLGLAVVVARLNSDRPFCETCLAWTDSERGVARLSGDGHEPTWEKVLGGDLPALAEFLPALPGAMQYVRLDLARCPKCPHSRFLSIASVTVAVDKQGKVSEKSRSLATNAVVTPSQCAVVEACGQLYQHSLEQVLDLRDTAEAGGPPAADEGES